MAEVDVWDLVLGFMDSQAVLTGEELGVFDYLDTTPRSGAEVARQTGLPEDSAERLLTHLCSLSLLEKLPDGRFKNAPPASDKLVKSSPGYIGAMFHHVRQDLYPLWGNFREALEEGQAQWHRITNGASADGGGMYDDPEKLRNFMAGMHAISYAAASEFASFDPDLGRIRNLVDIGGASGALLIALAERFPNLHGTVFDLAPVRPITEGYIREAGLQDRLTFHPGDFWEDDFPEADAFSLGFILHDWDTHGGSIILEKIAKAIRPGGTLIIGEYLFNDDKTGPHWVARADLNMLVAARGRERSAKEYADWIGEYGFELDEIYQTGHAKNFLIARETRKKPLATTNGLKKAQTPRHTESATIGV